MARKQTDKTLPLKGRVFVVSLGCPKNLVDTERLVGVLRLQGFQLVFDQSEATLVLLNTCAFIEPAREEALAVLRDIIEERSDSQLIVVAGCLVDRYGQQVVDEFPEVDLWISLANMEHFPQLVAQLLAGDFDSPPEQTNSRPAQIAWQNLPRRPLTVPHSVYLKISEGCGRRCAFCTIPLFRGPQRSLPVSHITSEAQILVESGARELTVIGQDIASYGSDLRRAGAKQPNLRSLLTELDQIEDYDWLRLLYLYPGQRVDDLVWCFKNLEHLLPYLDLPVQHLSDRVLHAMKRGYRQSEVIDYLNHLRAACPELVLRSTVIVGFPGESDRDFELLCEGVEAISPDYLGVFSYFDEEGTAAYNRKKKVPLEVVAERTEIMADLAHEIGADRANSRIGEVVPLMVDGRNPKIPADLCKRLGIKVTKHQSENCYFGHWWGQAPGIDGVVNFLAPENLIGQVVWVRLDGVLYPDYMGTLV